MSTPLEELKLYNRWVLSSTVRYGGKARKIPISPHTGKAAAINSPATWGTVYECAQARKKYPYLRNAQFAIAIPESYAVVDIDVDGQDALTIPGVPEIIDELNSYTERSAGGLGIHVWVRGHAERYVACSFGSAFKVEVFSSNRFMTVTGKAVSDCPPAIVQRQAELDALLTKLSGSVFVNGVEAGLSRPNIRAYSRTVDDPDAEYVADALRYIPPDLPYGDWVKVTAGIHDAFPNSTGVQLVVGWSGSHFRDGEDPVQVTEKLFKSFKRSTSGRRATVLSVYRMARDRGWRPEPRNKPDLTTTERMSQRRAVDDAYLEGLHDGMSETQRQMAEKLFPRPVVDLCGIACDGESVQVPMRGGRPNVEVRSASSGEVSGYLLPDTSFFVPETGNDYAVILPDSAAAANVWLRAGHVEYERWGSRADVLGMPQQTVISSEWLQHYHEVVYVLPTGVVAPALHSNGRVSYTPTLEGVYGVMNALIRDSEPV